MKILLFLLLLSGSLSSFASDYPALKIMPAELLNAGGVRIDVGYVPKARLLSGLQHLEMSGQAVVQ